MNLIEKLQAENEALKSKITSLEKLNTWYLEQLKLRQKEKFSSSSEKAEENQLSFSDVFSDLFNEVEVLREPIQVEPDEETLIPAHKRKNKNVVSSLIHFLWKRLSTSLQKKKKCVMFADQY